MKKKQPVMEKEETIVGYIIPSEWDKEDNVISISISTDDDDYLVELNKQGEELFDFLDEDIEAIGIVREDKDGTKRIKVTSYEVIEDTDEEYEEEEEEDFGFDDDDDEED